MHSSLGAHAEVICLFKLDSVSHPDAGDLGMGELHLESRRFPLCGFDISQASLDCNLPSCGDIFWVGNNHINLLYEAFVLLRLMMTEKCKG